MADEAPWWSFLKKKGPRPGKIDMAEHYELFLTCPKGLDGLLLDEAQALGLEEARAQVSAVRGRGDLETAYRLCLWSRLANRVLLVLSRFPVEEQANMADDQGTIRVDCAFCSIRHPIKLTDLQAAA